MLQKITNPISITKFFLRYHQNTPLHHLNRGETCLSPIHCYTRKDDAPPKRQKSRNSSLQFEGVQDIGYDGVLDEDRRGGSLTASSEAPTRTRPPGRKAEKEKLKRRAAGGVYKEVFQEMLTKREEMEEHKEARWIEVKAMEEWKAAFKERKVAIEEEKLRIMGNEVMNKNLE